MTLAKAHQIEMVRVIQKANAPTKEEVTQALAHRALASAARSLVDVGRPQLKIARILKAVEESQEPVASKFVHAVQEFVR